MIQKIARSYIDMPKPLYDLGLQLTNKSVTPDSKEASARLFEADNNLRGFYKIAATQNAIIDNLANVDKTLNQLKPDALKLYVKETVEGNQRQFISIAGFYWIEKTKLANIDLNVFTIKQLSITKDEDQKEILKVIKSCMKAQQAEI